VNGAAPAVLAIDGGNSKTDLALVAPDGSLLAAVRGPGLPGAADLGATLGLLAGLIGQAQHHAGLRGRPVAQHLSACVANTDLTQEEEQLAGALRQRGWAVTTEVANDTFAVLRAGLGDHEPPPWGVAVTCGAGINCVGVAPDGQATRFLALGTTTGDWGGGHGLGLAALWWAMRAEDGRGPQTVLRAEVAAHFGLPQVADVAVGIHTGAISEDSLRGLAPAVLAAASRGDGVARRLVQRQAEEVCVMALTAMRRLGMTGLDTPVVLGGAVLAARDPLLISAITRGIAAAAPGAQVRVTDIAPVAGAALLGLDHLGANVTAHKRLREAYAGGANPVTDGAAEAFHHNE
jgi:N-acetylglucosamine kinase-like BadF-type ATPase